MVLQSDNVLASHEYGVLLVNNWGYISLYAAFLKAFYKVRHTLYVAMIYTPTIIPAHCTEQHLFTAVVLLHI